MVAGGVPTDDGPFVGRTAELAALADAWRRAADGGERVIAVVRGDMGAGKTRLVAELAAAVAAEPARVLYGRCDEEPLAAFQPFVEALGEAVAAPDDGGGDPYVSRAKFFDRVARTLAAMASDQPLLLVLDDVHWADRDTALLIRYVLRHPDVASTLLVLLHRTTEMGAGHPLAPTVAEVRSDPATVAVTVGGLTEHDVADLAAAADVPISRDLVRVLTHQTGGNAFFVSELLGELPDLGAGGVPQGAQEVVDSRVARLSPAAREVLLHAAVLGMEFDATVLESLISLDEGAYLDALDEALASGLVRERRAATSVTLQFKHAVVHRCVQSQLSGIRRRRAHRRAAQVLHGTRGRDLDVARHLIAAGDEADDAAVMEACARAGERSWNMLAWDQAAAFYDAAVAAAERLGAAEATTADLLYRAGTSRCRNGDLDAGGALLARAVGYARALGDPRRVALALSEQVHFELIAGHVGTALDLEPMREAIDALHDVDRGLAARLLAQTAEAAWVAGDLARAQDLATRAIADGESAGERGAVARAHAAAGSTQWLRIDLPAALASFQASQRHARHISDDWYEASAAARVAFTLLWMGRLAEAEAAATAAGELAAAARSAAATTMAAAASLGVAAARGDFGAAEERGERAAAALGGSGYEWASSFVYPTLAWTRLVRGDWDGVDDALAAWIGRAEAAPNSPFYRQSAWWIRLLAAAWRGDTATVDAAIAADPGEVDAPLPHVLGSTQRFAALAQVRSLTGADVPLERADRRLARAAGGGLVITDGLVFVVARARGLAAAATGEFDAAARHLADAVDAARAAGALPELAHALFDRARLGASATASDDQREAAQLAARLGMAPLSARLEAGSG